MKSWYSNQDYLIGLHGNSGITLFARNRHRKGYLQTSPKLNYLKLGMQPARWRDGTFPKSVLPIQRNRSHFILGQMTI